jgi:hypothetical protein
MIENNSNKYFLIPGHGAYQAAYRVVAEFLPVVNIGWEGQSQHKSAFEMCLEDTIQNAMKMVSGHPVIDVNRFKVSKGVLDSFNEESWTRLSANTIKVIWDPSEFLPNSSVTDLIHICACDEEMSIVQMFINVAARLDASATIILNNVLAEVRDVYCLAFTQSVRFDSRYNLVGHTQYSGALQV